MCFKHRCTLNKVHCLHNFCQYSICLRRLNEWKKLSTADWTYRISYPVFAGQMFLLGIIPLQKIAFWSGTYMGAVLIEIVVRGENLWWFYFCNFSSFVSRVICPLRVWSQEPRRLWRLWYLILYHYDSLRYRISNCTEILPDKQCLSRVEKFEIFQFHRWYPSRSLTVWNPVIFFMLCDLA